ncbi:hypothetical protein P154DRAFT_574916 [Amniculicola lignicola CBS 123094]|uniref:Uncharacterized protein n=1 Tax=Amniculicola lignicola CBS 123094 TaxID=1392246 RepID=A0A6A5WLD2_9PLEO|nr:hypothetical protein P154DRAFT_574916 [Amniculicola lignicola CBS 123094]
MAVTLSEAQNLGLVLGFQVHPEANVLDPLSYTLPTGKGLHEIPLKNGRSIVLWDIFLRCVGTLAPRVETTKALWHSMGDRTIPDLTINITAAVNSMLHSQSHDINIECRSGHSNLVFQDTIGWNVGFDDAYATVQEFLDRHRKCIAFAELKRMGAADSNFFQNMDFKGVTFIVLFTNCYRLRDECFRDACGEYRKSHNDFECFDLQDPLEFPNDVQADVTS